MERAIPLQAVKRENVGTNLWLLATQKVDLGILCCPLSFHRKGIHRGPLELDTMAIIA
jgi:hypothetical protein